MNDTLARAVGALLDPLALVTILGSVGLLAALVYLIFFDHGSEL